MATVDDLLGQQRAWELRVCGRLGLEPSEVVAGSFDIDPWNRPPLILWRQVAEIDGKSRVVDRSREVSQEDLQAFRNAGA